MVEIIFHSHATTFDNEAGRASGHNDVALSPAGLEEAKRIGGQYKSKMFDIVFCSDLQRAYKTAEIAFGGRSPIVKDARLRECDYGEFTLRPNGFMKKQKIERISKPFPGGESYVQLLSRIKTFLKDLLDQYDNKRVIIVGHGGTRVGLEYWINNVSLEQAITRLKKEPAGVRYGLIELYPLRIDSQPLD